MFKKRNLLTFVVLTAFLYAGHLTAGESETAITNWAVIFNNPGACVDGCGEDDLFREGVNTSVCFLAGQSVQANRRVTLAGRIGEGTDHACLFGPGLVDADAAEIHMVLQQHGFSLPAGAGREEQVAFFMGNCNPACDDTQFAVHQPGDADADGISVSPVQRFADESVVAGSRSTLYRNFDDGFFPADNGIRMMNHTRLDGDE